MHFFMAAMGSAGDVYPFIAVGRELRRRGHSVDLQASPVFSTRIEAAGLDFVAAGTVADFERIVGRPELWEPRRGFALLIETLLEGLEGARASALPRLRPATVLVGSTLAWHLRMLQEERGFAAATMHLSPSCIVSAVSPPVLPVLGDLAWLPTGLLRILQQGIERRWLDPAITPGLDRIRSGFGLAPVRQVMSRWIHSPQLVIAAWPDWFAPTQSDWPPATRVTGFPRLGRAGTDALEPALERFLQAGPAPVGVTPGSAMAHGRSFFANAVAASCSLGHRVLLISPYVDQLPAGLPVESCHHVARAPFDLLVPRLAALVHHGGIGTCAQAFAAAVPQLISPFAHDQFDNAARVQRLGAGRRLSGSATRGRWVTALRSVVGDAGTALRCSELRARIDAEPPAASLIADQLETLRPDALAAAG